MGFFSNLFGKKKSLTFEEAREVQKEHVQNNPDPKNREDAMMRQASLLMTGQKFEESIQAYLKLADEFPEQKDMYLSQVGVGYFFLGQYDEAISFYMEAYREGYDKDMSDDNVWEACEKIYKRDNDPAAIQRYLELFPDGNYVKKANKLLK